MTNSSLYDFKEFSPGRDILTGDVEYLSSFLERCGYSNKGVLSLDIFDTLVARNQTSEYRRFYKIGEKIAEMCGLEGIDVTPVETFLARHLGTTASYRASNRVQGCREGHIEEIHTVASRMVTGRSDFLDKFIQCELDVEASELVVEKNIYNLALEHKKKGGEVILISDMYLGAKQIKKLLQSLNIDISIFSVIISSADKKVTKKSGKIFRILETILGRRAEDFFHIGDSFMGDYKQPKIRGWNALHLPLSKEILQSRIDDHVSFIAEFYNQTSVNLNVTTPDFRDNV